MNSWPGRVEFWAHLLGLAILVSCFNYEVVLPRKILPTMVIMILSLSVTIAKMPVYFLNLSRRLITIKLLPEISTTLNRPEWTKNPQGSVSIRVHWQRTLLKKMLFLLLFNSVKSKCSQYVKQLLISGVCQIFTVTKLRSKWTMILTGSFRLVSHFFLILF